MKKENRGGANRNQGRISPYGKKGSVKRSFNLPADTDKKQDAVIKINNLLKEYHETKD